MSTSLCQLQKASCLAEEPLVPYCRQGPSPTPACGPHTHTSEQNENWPPSPDRRGQAWCSPSVISIRILLPLTHLHVAHRPGWASVVLFSHPTVGPWLHELFSSWNQKHHLGPPSCFLCWNAFSPRPRTVTHLSSCHRRGPCWTRTDPFGPSSLGHPCLAGSPESWESWRSFLKTLDRRHQQMDPVD